MLPYVGYTQPLTNETLNVTIQKQQKLKQITLLSCLKSSRILDFRFEVKSFHQTMAVREI